MSTHKYIHIFCALALTFVGAEVLGFSLIEHVRAQAAVAIPFVNAPDPLVLNVASLLNMVISFMNWIMWILFVVLIFLLDPRFIFNINANPGGGNANNASLMDMLQQIWQLSRDLMNIVFALILVAVAIYTIITAKKELIQQYAPKFVIAVVLVNFSWFIPRVILDVANVTTSAIYGIPSIMNSQCAVRDRNGVLQQCEMITAVNFFVDGPNVTQLTNNGWQCKFNGLVCFRTAPLDPAAVAGHSAILNGLIVNHARMQQLADVNAIPLNAPGNNDVRRRIMFLMRSALIAVIHIAIVFPLLAMVVAFLIRIPVLWLSMAFMPFAFLALVGGEKIAQDIPEKIWKSFLKAAFLPAIAAVPLAVGFIIINTGTRFNLQGGGNLNPLNNIAFPVIQGVDDFWQFMWLLMSLAVIWSGVFAALRAGEITEFMGSTIQSIRNFGTSLGSLAVKLPLSVPLLGVDTGAGGSQRMSAMDLLRMPGQINARINQPGGLANLRNQQGVGQQGNQPQNRQQQVQNVVQRITNGTYNIQQRITQLNNGDGMTAQQFRELQNELRTNGFIDLPANARPAQVAQALREIHQRLRAQNGTGLGNEFHNYTDQQLQQRLQR